MQRGKPPFVSLRGYLEEEPLTRNIYLLAIFTVNVSFRTADSIFRVHKIYPDGGTGSSETAAQLYQTTRRHIPDDSDFRFQLLLLTVAFNFGQNLSMGL